MSGLSLLRIALVTVALVVFFAWGYREGKSAGCDQVGGVVRTDSHVYRVCR